MNLDAMIRRMIREELALALDRAELAPADEAPDPVVDFVANLPPGEEWTVTDLLPRLVAFAPVASGPWTVHSLGRRLTAIVGRVAGGRVLRHRRGRRAGVSLYSVALVPSGAH